MGHSAVGGWFSGSFSGSMAIARAALALGQLSCLAHGSVAWALASISTHVLSGAVKLLSGDATWRNLTALEYHYWTQPLPTPVAWYAAQLPACRFSRLAWRVYSRWNSGSLF